jgi:hypothetical protein
MFTSNDTELDALVSRGDRGSSRLILLQSLPDRNLATCRDFRPDSLFVPIPFAVFLVPGCSLFSCDLRLGR